MRTQHWIMIAVIAALLALALGFGAFVWPTMYRYDHISIGNGAMRMVRIHRFNGKTEVYYPNDGGWKEASN